MRARSWAGLLAILMIGVGAGGTEAAQLADPEWPCIQRRVPELSIGQMWQGPLPAEDAAAAPEAEALARSLAPRRVSVEDVAAAVEAPLQQVAPDERPSWLAGLFAAILDRINAERGEVIAGIGRYAARQQAIALAIEAMEDDLVTLERAPEAERDMDRIEELRDSLAWETRIYKERAQSLTYVCEAPVLLEKRAFAIGRALSALM
jgi:hypothetical protein